MNFLGLSCVYNAHPSHFFFLHKAFTTVHAKLHTVYASRLEYEKNHAIISL